MVVLSMVTQPMMITMCFILLSRAAMLFPELMAQIGVRVALTTLRTRCHPWVIALSRSFKVQIAVLGEVVSRVGKYFV